MSPEEIKQIEKVGARKAVIEQLIQSNDRFSSALTSYSKLDTNTWSGERANAGLMETMQEKLVKITALIAHLKSGT